MSVGVTGCRKPASTSSGSAGDPRPNLYIYYKSTSSKSGNFAISDFTLGSMAWLILWCFLHCVFLCVQGESLHMQPFED